MQTLSDWFWFVVVRKCPLLFLLPKYETCVILFWFVNQGLDITRNFWLWNGSFAHDDKPNYRPYFLLVRPCDGLTFALLEIRTTLLVHGHGSNSSHRQRLTGRTSRTCILHDSRAASSTGTWPRELQAILRADPVDNIAKRTSRRRWGITDDHLHIHMDPVVGLPTRHLIAQIIVQSNTFKCS